MEISDQNHGLTSSKIGIFGLMTGSHFLIVEQSLNIFFFYLEPLWKIAIQFGLMKSSHFNTPDHQETPFLSLFCQKQIIFLTKIMG